MARVTTPALALVALLLVAAPALGDDMDSEHQTQGYGKIAAYVCGGIAAIVLLVGGVHVIKGFLAEAERGKKTGIMIEETLDDIPPPKKRALYLGEKVPDWKAGPRAEATAAALAFLARGDDWFDPKYLTKITTAAFRLVKAAVEERSTKKVADRVTAGCLERLREDILQLRTEGEKRVFGAVEVTDVDVVHIEAPANPKDHTFTALVAARSRDYIADDKSGEVLRGDKKTYVYQEFWRFRRTKERWLVERIRPAGDMDTVLHAKNVLTQKDLDAFAKKADPEHLREFVAR
jgi:hypothetical protein